MSAASKNVSVGITGKEGEAIAVQFLKQQGYRMIERNFKCAYGEIDLIAWDHETLVFIEVKSRSSGKFGGPAMAVNFRKQEKIGRVAALYLKKNKGDALPPCRFDVVGIVKEVYGTTAVLFRNAFEMSSSALAL